MTPLRGADGQIYALAQGNLIVGGAGASAGGSKVQINHLSAGRMPGRRDASSAACRRRCYAGDSLQLDLRAADFNTAAAVAKAINRRQGRRHRGPRWTAARCACRCRRPASTRVAFLADIENLPLALAPPAARVVLNARTGSVVMNEAVTIGACAVAHGSLSVTISSTPVVSQPNAVRPGPDGGRREGRHRDHAAGRRADADARGHPADRRGARR